MDAPEAVAQLARLLTRSAWECYMLIDAADDNVEWSLSDLNAAAVQLSSAAAECTRAADLATKVATGRLNDIGAVEP